MNSMAVGYYYIPSESKTWRMRLELKADSFHAPSCVVCVVVPRDIHAKMTTSWVLTRILIWIRNNWQLGRIQEVSSWMLSRLSGMKPKASAHPEPANPASLKAAHSPA